MPKKNKKRMSLENLKDLEEGFEKVPKEKKPQVVTPPEKPIVKKEIPIDPSHAKELEKLFEELNKWNVALKVNLDMQKEHRATIQDYKGRRDELKNEISSFRTLANEAKNKRDKINEKINELKKQRDDANQKIKEYKSKRDAKWNDFKRIREEFKNFINQKEELKDKLFEAKKIMERIDLLDWDIQTKSMSWEEECNLMDQVENSFSELKKIKELKKFRSISSLIENNAKNLDDLREEANQFHQWMLDFVAESNYVHEQILNLVKESENYHKEMISNFEKANELQIHEEEAHQNMIEAVKEINLLKKGEQEIDKEKAIVKAKLGKLREKEKGWKSKEEEKLLDKKIELALNKYKEGKKLTFIEYKILLENNLLE